MEYQNIVNQAYLDLSSFELLSEHSGNVLEANNILSTKIHNAVKDNKTNNASISNENRKSAPKNKGNKNDQKKIVTERRRWLWSISADQRQSIWRLTFSLH